jgi:hypothetical protein
VFNDKVTAMRRHVIPGFLVAVAMLAAGAAWAQDGAGFAALARSAGTPQVPGLRIVYLSPLGDPAQARWRNIIVHQTEGPPGSARALAALQAKNPARRGVMLWVETDGTVYWATPETAVTTHGDGANRKDNKYIDNSKTYRQVTRQNSIGVEFVGNYPDVRKPPTEQQVAAWLVLVRFLQERYGIPVDRVYAHNWIDHKDHRYCEGCDLAQRARAQGYVPRRAAADAVATAPALSEPPLSTDAPAGPSDCVKRLADIAVFTPMPPLSGPNGCGAIDVVRLEAAIMPDRSRVPLEPPAMLRCTMAEAVAAWSRGDLAPAALTLGGRLKAIVNFNSYECRGRNRAIDSKLSEHGRANALDIKGIKLANGAVVALTDPAVPKEFRENVRVSACRRFTTVLGPGSDGFHENHVHVDLVERSRGYRLCQWDVREPQPIAMPDSPPDEPGGAPALVPLPQPKPSAIATGAPALRQKRAPAQP